MIIKDASSCYQRAVQGTDRGRGHHGDHTVIVIDDSDSDNKVDQHTDLKAKGKTKKNKHLVKAKCSVHTDSKKKGKAKLKAKANAKHLVVSAHIPDSESLKDTGNIVKPSKRKKDQRYTCEQDGHCESPKQQLPKMQLEVHFVISKRGKRKIMDHQGNDNNDSDVAKRKRRKKQPKPTGNSEDEDRRPISPNPTEVSQEIMFLDQEKFGTTVHNPDAGFARKGKQFCKIQEKGPFCPSQVDQNQKSPGTCEGLDDTDCVSEGESKIFKKKTKKKKRKREKVPVPIITVDSQESYPRISGKDLLKSKSKKKKGKSKLCLTDPEEGKKVKRKEKIRAKVVSKESSVFENGQGLPANKQKLATCEGKITGKKSKDKENSAKSCISRSDKSSKKHGKKRKRREDNEQEVAQKKTKIKKESKEGDDEIKVVAMKKGNCDEINIDKLRRQALQDEIDRESGKTKAFKQEPEPQTQFGQWSTAAFETSEQKAKFLRLLGGFKKASAAPQDPPVPAGKLNMAMDRSKERKLQHSLQAEFEKAMDWKQHRRIGLGFQPATQKHGHIDKYASKSKKFGD